MNLTSGTVLQKGKYRIDQVLGIGGFGITYRATHTYLAQTVTLKTLNGNLHQHPNFAKFQQQFIAQAHRFSWCQHPNIARVLDFFEEAGLCFVVMEYIAGQSLAQLIKSGQRLPETEALHCIRQIASALKTLHQSGLVHRDIAPENIIQRTGTNIVMLTGFGIICDFPANMRQTYNSLLSAGYAPIEQYLPETKEKKPDVLTPQSSRSSSGVAKSPYILTPATDIYGLAATFYYLLAGEAPVPVPLRDRIPLFSLRQVQPLLCPGIERAILWGLEMNAHHRPQTVEHWLTFLEEQQLLERQKEEAENTELSLFPSPLFMLFLFFFISGTSGWLGFDFTRRSISVATLNKSLNIERDLIPKENWQYTEFRNQDPSTPLFEKPSVESNPTFPLEENELPKSNLNSSSTEPNSTSTPTVPSSPTSTTATPVPTPESQEVRSSASEPESQEVRSFAPKGESQEVRSYVPKPEATLLPDDAIAPAPVTVPEVVPLPSEPSKSSASAPGAPPGSVEVSPFPETEPPKPLPPEAEPLLPNVNDNNVESPVGSPSPSGLEPDVPFPQPASN
jgi:serine/threonine-protein kinase